MKLGLGLGFNKGSGGGFSPADLTNLALWLDAADTSSIVHTANAVSQWNDKSGLGRHATQGTGANQPLTNTRTVNGRNVLDFFSPHFMTMSSGLHNINQAPNTVFAAIALDGATPAALLDGKQAGFTNRIFGMRFDTSNTRLNFINGNFGSDARITFTASTNPCLYTGRTNALSAGQVQVYKDGVLGATIGNGAANSALDLVILGKNYGGNFDYMDGPIAEILIYSRALTNTEMNQVGAYFSAKWGTPWTNL